MKKRINIQFVLIALIATVITLFMTVYVFYGLFKDEVSDELRMYAHIFVNSQDAKECIEITEEYIKQDKIRVTVIDTDGDVIYDSSVDIKKLDNHADRPEVEQAMLLGEGEVVRKSDTLDKSTFYYAVRLDDGSIIRVAKESDSVWRIFISAFPAITIILVFMVLICVVLAHWFTKSLVAPIEEMANDMENMETVSTYKELMPFINTIRKQHNDILKSAKMRQEFTANVSHELKTPLTAISGYSELIESGMAANDDVVRFASEIHRNSNRLLVLINDIIKLSQMDASDMALHFEDVDLYTISKACVDMLQVNANNHKVKLSLHGESAVISAEKVKVEELVYNLCDNAIRYNNENGTVDVYVEKNDNKVSLCVKDTGIGISKEHQERIFERFYRVDKSRSKSTGGTGLGLAIVKHIVAQHNAEMSLDSQLGKGTSIKITFNAKDKK